MTDVGLREIAKIGGLRSLSVGSDGITDRGLRSIATLKLLESLTLTRCKKVTDAGLTQLAHHLYGLTAVDLACCELLTDHAALEVAKLPALSLLNLSECHRISDACIATIAALPGLVSFTTPRRQ